MSVWHKYGGIAWDTSRPCHRQQVHSPRYSRLYSQLLQLKLPENSLLIGGFAGPGAAAEASLGRFLETGGCLLLSSQDYFYDRGLTAFMRDYLGVDSVSGETSYIRVRGTGKDFNELGPFDLSPSFPNFSDTLTPSGLGRLAFKGHQQGAGLSSFNGVWATVFLAFPFEAIQSESGRLEVMERVLNLCSTTAIHAR